MTLKDRYVNPFTDFGFKKIFGSEVNKDLLIAKLTFIYLELPKFRKRVDELVIDFDKWCYLLRNLPELTDRPKRLQEKVFSKVFEIAEIAKYSPVEAAVYEDSLKIYRDLKNVIDTAFDEGKAEGIEAGIMQGRLEGIE